MTKWLDIKNVCCLGGSPGLVFMGGDSRSKGHGFKPGTVYCIDFFQHICSKNLQCLFEKTKNKRKRGRGWPILKKIMEHFRESQSTPNFFILKLTEPFLSFNTEC